MLNIHSFHNVLGVHVCVDHSNDFDFISWRYLSRLLLPKGLQFVLHVPPKWRINCAISLFTSAKVAKKKSRNIGGSKSINQVGRAMYPSIICTRYTVVEYRKLSSVNWVCALLRICLCSCHQILPLPAVPTLSCSLSSAVTPTRRMRWLWRWPSSKSVV